MSVLKFHVILTLLSQPSALPIFDQISPIFFSRSFELLFESEVLHLIMSEFRKISDCLDENGDIDVEAYVRYKRQRREAEEEMWLEEEEAIRKMKRKRSGRDYEGYDRTNVLQSDWYRRYVADANFSSKKINRKRFRRRFRMPYSSFLELVAEARADNWFPTCEKPNALGQLGIPLEILILGALRYLGRGWTFDDVSESTGVSEEVHRKFLKLFCRACRLNLYPKWVKRPETEEEIADCMSEFKDAGFDGCIGSADVTHVVLEKCYAKLKNQHLGGKSSMTTRAFQVVVNHRRQIIAYRVVSLSNKKLRDNLVVNFHMRWSNGAEFGKIVWPSRTGKVECT